MPILLQSELEFNSLNERGEEIYKVVYLESPVCPECQEEMQEVKERCLRIDKRLGGEVRWLIIERRLCTNTDCSCKSKRLLPNTLVPYKHYGSDIVGDSIREALTGEVGDSVNEEVSEGGSENLPSEVSQRRWFQWMMVNMEILLEVIEEQHRLFPDAECGRFKKGTLDGFMEYREGDDGDHWLGVLLTYVSCAGCVMRTAYG